MFSRIGAAAIKKDLTNTIKLCEALGNPQNTFKSVHIAGTNGKGSTSHMLAAILQTAGYKTGLYTSPHLYDFRERIKVDGKMCEQDFVVDFVQRIQHLIHEIEPSFFEITVAMAFDYFAQQKVDIAVVETGLGGRLDSTNIISPVLSVITNIGWDHMNLLGNTLEEIAFEKAGIIKEKVPVVIGETAENIQPIFAKQASLRSAPIVFADQKRYVDEWSFENDHIKITVAEKNQKHTYKLDLGGIYQTKNLLSVLEAIHQLQIHQWKIEPGHIDHALQHVKKLTGLHGRWEVIQQHPKVVLDVAHNVDGVKQLAAQLEYTRYNKLHMVIGMVKDKEVDAVLHLLPKHASYYFTKAQIPRALDEVSLQEKAKAIGLKGNCFMDVDAALNDALTHASTNDLILVCGSVFLVAEVKR